MPVDAIGSILNQQDGSVTKNNTIDQESFIKLFLAQLAQFSNLEQTRQTSQNTESLLVMQSSSQALNLLSKNIEVQVEGAAKTGKVIAVNFTSSGPEITVQTDAGPVLTAIHLSQISLVKP